MAYTRQLIVPHRPPRPNITLLQHHKRPNPTMLRHHVARTRQSPNTRPPQYDTTTTPQYYNTVSAGAS